MTVAYLVKGAKKRREKMMLLLYWDLRPHNFLNRVLRETKILHTQRKRKATGKEKFQSKKEEV